MSDMSWAMSHSMMMPIPKDMAITARTLYEVVFFAMLRADTHECTNIIIVISPSEEAEQCYLKTPRWNHAPYREAARKDGNGLGQRKAVNDKDR